jgi:hypothetical protein
MYYQPSHLWVAELINTSASLLRSIRATTSEGILAPLNESMKRKWSYAAAPRTPIQWHGICTQRQSKKSQEGHTSRDRGLIIGWKVNFRMCTLSMACSTCRLLAASSVSRVHRSSRVSLRCCQRRDTARMSSGLPVAGRKVHSLSSARCCFDSAISCSQNFLRISRALRQISSPAWYMRCCDEVVYVKT